MLFNDKTYITLDNTVKLLAQKLKIPYCIDKDMNQKCPLNKTEWIKFLITKSSRQLNYMLSKENIILQDKTSNITVISVLLVFITTLTNILDFSNSITIILISVIVYSALYLCIVYRANKKRKSNLDITIKKIEKYENIIDSIIMNKRKTFDEIKNEYFK